MPIGASQSLLHEEAAVDSGMRRERPMAMTTQLPRGTANEPAATAAPPTGLPAEQLYTWLEWVQDDLRRLEARLDYLESRRVRSCASRNVCSASCCTRRVRCYQKLTPASGNR